jgi:hypothetical protein
MRRAIAISLMMLFSWTLIAPLTAVDADANLPACCRGKGKCHCRICERGDYNSHQKGFAAVAAKCPCCPASASAVYSSTYKPEAAGAFTSETIFRPACAPQTETHSRISFLRSHPKRGPPAPHA